MGTQYDSGLCHQDDLAAAYNRGITDAQKSTILAREKQLSDVLGRRIVILDVIDFLREHPQEFKAFLESKNEYVHRVFRNCP